MHKYTSQMNDLASSDLSELSLRKETENDRLKLRILLLEQQLKKHESQSSSLMRTSTFVTNTPTSNVEMRLKNFEYEAALLRSELDSYKTDKALIKELEFLLNKKEYELEEMKLKFNEESIKQDRELAKCKTMLNNKEEEYLNEKSKSGNLQKEIDKLKAKLNECNKYIDELATKDEIETILNDLNETKRENEDLKKSLSEYESKVCRAKQFIKDKNMEVKELKEKIERVELEKEKLRLEYENYKLATQSVGDLIAKCEQNATLKAELESAKKFLVSLQERIGSQQVKFDKQTNELKENLKQECENVQRLKIDLETKEKIIKKLDSKIEQNGLDNKQLVDENMRLNERINSFEVLMSADSFKLLKLLFKELSVCSNDLNSLVNICADIYKGKSIDVCILLGRTNSKPSDYVDLTNNDTMLSMINSDNLAKKTNEIKELRKKMEQIRNTIADQYAENIGANLVDNLEYLHPAEVEICNKLAELGNMYRKICEFYDNYAHGKSFANKSLKTGLYLHSFCDALNTVILSPYRETISQLERDLLKDNYHNVTYLQSHLENHFIIFYSANNLIDEIMLKNLHGCQIIDLVYKYTISGNTIVKETFIKILTINNEVMYKQLRDWMIYGHLNDKYDEFFISLDKILNDTTATVESVDKNGTATSKTQDEEGFFMSNEMEDLFLGHRFSSRYSQYCLNCTRLPSFINLKTANKILFAGELLQLFKSKSLNEIYSTSTHTNEMSQIASATSSFHFSLNLSVNKVQHIADSNKYLNEEFNLINKKMDVFSKKIVNISRDEFSIINFDNLINEIRNYVSESVWHLIVEKYKLLDEFQRLKDMYLIGRGELFATFLESSNQLLNKQVDANFEYNINYIFQKSISRMLLDNESWLNKFRIIVNDENQLNVRKSNVNNGWSKIGLNYRVEWPFHSLITPKVLKKYNEIFNYLLSIRRVQIELNECFLFQMRLDVKKKSKISSNADVLETQFSELEENIKASKDFEQIRYAHDTFLTKIQYQSFILNKIVSNSLNEIMETCLLFSTFVKSFEDVANLEKNGERLNDIIKKFQTQTQTLYKTFKTLEKKQLGSHLEQLLTRINFNNYLEDHQGL